MPKSKFGGIDLDDPAVDDYNTPPRPKSKFGGIDLYEQAEEAEDGFSALQMISNVPGSTGKYIGELADAVTSPIDTLGTMGNLAAGAIQKFPGGKQILEPLIGKEDKTKYADAIGAHYAEKYGSWDAFLEALEEDPISVLADAATVFTGGAALPGKVGQLASKTGAALEPLNIATNTVGMATKALPQSVPRKLYSKAAKFGTTILPETRNKMLDTALKEQIMPTQKGLDKLNEKVSNSMSAIDNILEESAKKGKRIPTGRLGVKLRELYDGIDPKTMVGAERYAEQVRGFIKERYEALKGVDAMTPQEVQKLKQSLDDQINYLAIEKAGGSPRPGAEDAATAMRRDAKESLEEIDPKVAELNREAGDLLELRNRGLSQSASRIENRDVIGAGPIMTVAPGAFVGGEKGAAAGAALAVGQMPKIQAGLALYIDKMKRSPMADVYFDNNRLTAAGRLAIVNAIKTQEELEWSDYYSK